MATLTFYLFAIMLLSILGFVMWSGVGSKRRTLGRGFGVMSFAAAGWLALELYDLVT
ncbi:hypothetical protein [Altererythrobacter sp. ZODW24]|uniref:hypothetical protein n=1 Tax=Altererythrobacter sp. ZODW24 TaxID=2185142 RepID=UPI0013B3B3B1|nr:hypothetical protein [Altererythrobacter sp. ZODW24]